MPLTSDSFLPLACPQVDSQRGSERQSPEDCSLTHHKSTLFLFVPCGAHLLGILRVPTKYCPVSYWDLTLPPKDRSRDFILVPAPGQSPPAIRAPHCVFIVITAGVTQVAKVF